MRLGHVPCSVARSDACVSDTYMASLIWADSLEITAHLCEVRELAAGLSDLGDLLRWQFPTYLVLMSSSGSRTG